MAHELIFEDFEKIDTDEKIKRLLFIKLNIISNDKYKSELKPNILHVTYCLTNSSNKLILENSAIILQEFCSLRSNYESVCKNCIISTIISSTVRQPDILLKINVRTIVDYLTLNHIHSIQLEKLDDGISFAELLIECLMNDKASSLLINDICQLIPFIKPMKLMKKFYSGIMKRISLVISPLFQIVLAQNTSPWDISSYENCQTAKFIPQPPSELTLNTISTDLCPLLYTLAHIIEALHILDIKSIRFPQSLYFTLTSFFKCYHLNILLATTNVFVIYAQFYSRDNEKITLYDKILPTMLTLIQRTENSKSLQSLLLSKFLVPKKMAPLRLLSVVIKEYPQCVKLLISVNFVDIIASIIIKNYSSEQKFLNENSLSKISNALLVLSYIGAVEDDNRDLIIEYNLAPVIRDSLERHEQILKAMPDQPNCDHLKILNLSNQITVSSCLLLRSLSRSANLLRTFLTDFMFVDVLLDILKNSNNYLENLEMSLNQREVELKALILGIISNLVVEFSSIRQQIERQDLFDLLQKFIVYSKYDILKINSLLVIRNSLFCEATSFKLKFMSTLSLEKIFELCDYPNPKVQLQCFNILRNILTTTMDESEKIYHAYNNSKARLMTGDFDFLEFLRRHLETTDDPLINVAICYVVVHFASSTLENKVLLMRNHRLLQKLLQMLKLKVNENLGQSEAEKQWNIKTSISWIITNLTWREETFTDNDFDSEGQDLNRIENNNDQAMEMDRITSSYRINYLKTKDRAFSLIEMGFYDALKNLSAGSSSVDFKERARNAIFQLMFHDISSS